MNLPNFEWVHFCPPFWEVRRHASLHHPLAQKYLKAPEVNWKNYFTLTKVPVKESKVGFRRHKLISMFYRRNSMRVRTLLADSTRRNNRCRRSFGWIHPTNETNLFALWFSFFAQEERPFYHDKTVNIKLSEPPCFKKPLTVLRAGSCVLSHCEQFWAESSVNNKISWNSEEHDTNIWFQYCIFHYMSEWVKSVQFIMKTYLKQQWCFFCAAAFSFC